MLTDRDAATMRVIEELKRIYKSKILPLEKMYQFEIFHVPSMSDAEFDSKPQIMNSWMLKTKMYVAAQTTPSKAAIYDP